MKDEKTIKVNGLDIRQGSIYKVVNRPDKSAPDGYQREGSTKVPSYGIGNNIGCNYVENSVTGHGVHDTGLYEDSPCYSNTPKEEVRLKVALLKELIVEPYERYVGQQGVLNHSNKEFWDSYTTRLEVDRPFRTESASDLLDLFISVLSYQLTPKSEVKNPKFSVSQYIVEDISKAKTHAEESNDNFVTALTNFTVLYSSNKYLAIKLLDYIGITGVSEDIKTSSLNSMLFSWLSTDTSNPNKMNKAYEIASNAKKSNQIILYSKLKDLSRKGAVSNSTGEYYYGDIYLGSDLKTAAENVNSKADLKTVKAEIMEK